MDSRFLAVQHGNSWQLQAPSTKYRAELAGGHSVALVGFISNLVDLENRSTLSVNPHSPQIERLVRLLDHGGGAILEYLKGSFSVLAIQPETGRLWARRDRLGAHAVYLAQRAQNAGYVIGNSAADVFRASGQHFAEDPEYIAAMFSLSGQTPDGRSAFRHVQALLPGELLAIEGTEVRRTRTPAPMDQESDWSSDAEAVDQFRGLLTGSIRNCLARSSDTAVMLSGGMDSGPVAMIADRHCKAHDRRLVPISWSLRGFPEADESRWVDLVAKDLSQPLIRFDASGLLPFSSLGAAPVNPEAPSFNAFRPLINRCYQTAAEQGCTVILNGSTGDDLYPRYPLLYRGYLANGEWNYLLEDLKESFKRGGWRALWKKPPLRELLKKPFRRLRSRPPPWWFTPTAKNHWMDLQAWPPECQDHPVPEYAAQLYGRRMASGHADEYLQSCSLGVERRDPFHDEDLVAFMLNVPFSFSIRHHRTKWIMREAMRGLLPEPVRRKRRTGVLSRFYLAGRSANRAAITSFLFEHRREWQRWVKADAVRSALADEGQQSASTALLVDRSIGYVNWLHYWQSN